jgi:catechol 2,3-dioxygenase-like lactoylglutathione lyase family enzyme
MLADHPIHTALPATDLERARRFYAEKLGLTPEIELPDVRDGLFYRCGGGTRFLLFPSPNAASGTHTQMTWMTHDIEADVAELKARGVVFEEYDTPQVKTVKSVATIGQSKGAWFKDSEGNLLALGQFDQEIRSEKPYHS